MGLMLPEEQASVYKLYGYRAEYRCDYENCRLPIFAHQIMHIDPKGGYYSKPEGLPTFLPRKPKRVYHVHCGMMLRGLKSQWDGDFFHMKDVPVNEAKPSKRGKGKYSKRNKRKKRR